MGKEDNKDQGEGNSETDTGKASQIDYAKMAESIGAKVAEAVAGTVNPQIEKINDKVEAAISRQAQGLGDEGDEGDSKPEDDDLLTRGEAKKMQGLSKKDVADQIKKTLTETTVKATKDAEAYNVFPMLNPHSKLFDKDFHQSVLGEMNERVSAGSDRDNDPNLIMDSASAVFAKNPKYQRKSLDAAKEAQRLANNQEGSFNIHGTGKKAGDKPNAAQIAFAEKMNIPKERFEKIFKNHKLGS